MNAVDIASDAYQQGYQRAETDLLWKLCEVRTLRLKYLHNKEALKAIEDVLEIFKDVLKTLENKGYESI